jgi:hypothetical protein
MVAANGATSAGVTTRSFVALGKISVAACKSSPDYMI